MAHCTSTTRNRRHALSDGAKDTRVETAKDQQNVALAMLAFNFTGKVKDGAKVCAARHQATCGIAKEKCDGVAGKERDICFRAAETERDTERR